VSNQFVRLQRFGLSTVTLASVLEPDLWLRLCRAWSLSGTRLRGWHDHVHLRRESVTRVITDAGVETSYLVRLLLALTTSLDAQTAADIMEDWSWTWNAY